MKTKCKHTVGSIVALFGQPVDPCRYRRKEIHQNVTVEVSQCEVCGHIDISWHKQDDTISDYFEDLEEEPEDE